MLCHVERARRPPAYSSIAEYFRRIEGTMCENVIIIPHMQIFRNELRFYNRAITLKEGNRAGKRRIDLGIELISPVAHWRDGTRSSNVSPGRCKLTFVWLTDDSKTIGQEMVVEHVQLYTCL
ncbi:unnamed protein product [Soboliphyme baturini]|uniref:Uncharacterized protein n=1 Tax=Soboliphyme baturini TaxID=241478 RepID=A0A183J5E5_9BILA|nr:unnamed protein product [Soboliphyme baturini]